MLVCHPYPEFKSVKGFERVAEKMEWRGSAQDERRAQRETSLNLNMCFFGAQICAVVFFEELARLWRPLIPWHCWGMCPQATTPLK